MNRQTISLNYTPDYPIVGGLNYYLVNIGLKQVATFEVGYHLLKDGRWYLVDEIVIDQLKINIVKGSVFDYVTFISKNNGYDYENFKLIKE